MNPDKIVFGCKNKKDFNEIKKNYIQDLNQIFSF